AAMAAAETEERAEGQAVVVGSRVRTGAAGVGQVVELRGDGRAVVMVGSLRVVVDTRQLEVLRGEAPKPAVHEPVRTHHAPAIEAPMEIDLRGMTGDEAEMATLAALDAAVLADRPYLRIIHGMGTGVVRARVQQLLSRDSRVQSHAFAPPNQGGSGATVAELKS
ncbi:MAG TPA: Smr/MutS family protein, partial [Gemmatimonadales bacterium]|nr:Smr/MutS family protein [Gemmatimonadales bacterium]